ncbi:MAG: hypothetical protein GX774_20705 [Armatimonadetes bacterium]|nr:hypothetical protein [Armatimonadota bacterium]
MPSGEPNKPVKEELTIAPGADPREAAAALATLRDEGTVREIMNRLAPPDAALIIAHAPDSEAQTRLIWSLAKPQRAAVVDHLAPVTVAALIQNRERRNRRLLGDLSAEHFAEILAFCGPKQRYYWMSLANSFADVGANLLVLLLPPEEVAEALLTVPEFRRKLYRLRAFLPGGFEEYPPVDDPALRAVLTRLGQYDADRYHEVIELAVEMVEGARPFDATDPSQPAEPVLLPTIPELPPLVPGEAPPVAETPAANPLLPIPVPATTDLLLRKVASLLPPARRRTLEQEMERAFRDEVIAAGGSVAEKDIARVAARLQAYLRLGLHGVSEEPEQIAAIVAQVPLRQILERGGVALEQLRQIALRLRPFEAVLDARQRDLMQALTHLQPAVEPETGAAALLVPAADRRRRPETIPVSEIHEHLGAVSTWVAITRALGLRALTEKLAAAPNGSQAVLAALAVSLLSYGGWDPRALESGALRAFRDRHFDRSQGRWLPGTEERVRQAVREWTAQARLEPATRPRVIGMVLAAFARLEEFLRERKRISWDQFAPGRRPSRRRRMVSLEAVEEETAEEEAGE